jgi:hypothetical protein
MTTGYKIFAQLCEAYITEVSSSLNLVKQQPGGKEVIQKLHTSSGLAHDQSYSPVAKISWSDLKDSYKGAWVIIVGTKGTGAIRASGGNTGSYEAFASVGGDVQSKSDSRGGNILDFLKANIGNLKTFYVGKNTTAVRDKKKERNSRNAAAGPNIVNQDTLVKKFRPLFAKAIAATLADVKGMASSMLKNDAFDKAKKKIDLLQTLERASEEVAGGSETPEIIKRAVQIGILMAASHYYPDQTGDITRTRYGGVGYEATNSEGPKQLLQDISNGDTAKLGTILGFFKRSLISS